MAAPLAQPLLLAGMLPLSLVVAVGTDDCEAQPLLVLLPEAPPAEAVGNPLERAVPLLMLVVDGEGESLREGNGVALVEGKRVSLWEGSVDPLARSVPMARGDGEKGAEGAVVAVAAVVSEKARDGATLAEADADVRGEAEGSRGEIEGSGESVEDCVCSDEGEAAELPLAADVEEALCSAVDDGAETEMSGVEDAVALCMALLDAGAEGAAERDDGGDTVALLLALCA